VSKGSEAHDRTPNDSSKDLTSGPTMSTEAERSSPLPAGVPSRIGSYVIKRVIASGGMGTVFEALQENPRRPVAVKVIKEPLASEGAIGRLEYEAQILARLRHPGIAQIYEAGSFEDRGSVVPFFAMEYIPNAHNITAYARDKQLDHRQRLELFLQVCEAVHHGHQRGIVHRDLKPSNILVDSSGRVRIIDFGVARATDSDTKRAGAHTEYGSLVGSVQYMSPEQFDADPHDIDTRSDVYALGVVLYELLAGSLPYQTNSKRVFDIAHEVRHGDRIPLGSRVPSLRGDMEAIVHKALEKERQNRYQSAHGLALDIQRHLAGDAVAAQPPGFLLPVAGLRPAQSSSHRRHRRRLCSPGGSHRGHDLAPGPGRCRAGARGGRVEQGDRRTRVPYRGARVRLPPPATVPPQPSPTYWTAPAKRSAKPSRPNPRSRPRSVDRLGAAT
jgi:serine/threonine protein kinase